MKRTIDNLGNLVNYDRLAAIKILQPPRIWRTEIPELVFCQKFEKAKERLEQTRERLNKRIVESQASVESRKAQVEELTKEIGYNTGEIKRPGFGRFFGDTLESTKPGIADSPLLNVAFGGSAESTQRLRNEKIRKYNAILDVVRRLQDQKDSAVDQFSAAVDKHKDLLAEVHDKLEELTSESLALIDDDVVTVLDKCGDIAGKLAYSQKAEDVLAATETCFIALKIHHIINGEITGSSQRVGCRNRIAEINKLFDTISKGPVLGTFLEKVFHRNHGIVQNNAELHRQKMQVICSVNQSELSQKTANISAAVDKKYDTNFSFDGIIDPVDIDLILERIKVTKADLTAGIETLRSLAASTKEDAEHAVDVHQKAESLLLSMTTNVQGIDNDLILTPGHFLLEILDQRVIEDIFDREIRPVIEQRRKLLVAAIGEGPFNALATNDPDRYSVERSRNAIKDADLIRLRAEREKIEPRIQNLVASIAACDEKMAIALEIPQRNADTFRSGLSTKYILSCIPGIGIVFAFGILRKVKAFEAGFRSANPAYRDLAVEVLNRSQTMKIITMVLGIISLLGGVGCVILGATGVGMGILDSVSATIVIIIGAVGTALGLLYVLTVAIIFAINKRVMPK